jgi:hypothetical protein
MSLQSFNYPDRFIRHRNFAGEVTRIESDADKVDATFSYIYGDRNPSTGDGISFQASNFPRFFLRHQDFIIKLHEKDQTLDPDRPPSYMTPAAELFNADSSFRVVQGLADGAWVSFQSLNFQDRYIRHRDFKLYLEPATDDLARADSTFRILDGFIPGPQKPAIR